ncbi:helix-turn-helix domain-containing protein [Streptomyces cocklensis]|uniref:DNA-binding protein n=1 Tax=Actinacidiphila cocklensis TaxID=887465 RepID=A0A9W4DVE8_9ACTN|nr:helix-turn-helix transcriptional regulator [Actinacidiphila cocklensis]MDD1060764.1 helix-turn-helix domain-containing protein [Actinacidiphila cocklensis]WSX73716.1 helix-turn-helix domain-containing protein [Streptomyces sp. NBC_00899]WSX80221.1 helix-turn-helix domain-containing protein [Streptomyces sp. NBC_00899]CAG6394632.1 Putative DNA-binding protein [Actinacidiphila cocklensis]
MSAQPSRAPRGVRHVRPLSGRAPTAQRMIFGETLRKHRDALGLTEKEVARAVGGCSASKISRLESGEHDFKEKDVLGLLDVYGVVDADERERLLGLSQQANEKGWWEAWRDVAPKELQTYVSLEDIAARIRSYESGQLLGLLQIPDYTRALVKANSLEPNVRTAERIIELRTMRAQRFLRDSGTQLICVLDEVTLSRGYGTNPIMRRQIEHLIELAGHERISFRLAPSARLNLPVQIGTTTVFDFAADQLPAIVYIERCNGGLYLQDRQEVDSYERGFDRLMVGSLGSAACVQKLKDYCQKYR